MQRQYLFSPISQRLNILAYHIEVQGRINILDLHIHSENFYLHFLNLVFDWNLKNRNTSQQNMPGLDLIDEEKKIIVQVSGTATKEKIQSSLEKDLSIFRNFQFIFISISKNANNVRKAVYKNPNQLVFSPKDDIYDIPKLLLLISSLDVPKMEQIDDFLKKELDLNIDPPNYESNLSVIIDLLSKEDWSQYNPENHSFDIERKIEYNCLNSTRDIIRDYAIHSHRVDKIYAEFDKFGKNKSISVLNGIRSLYLTCDQALSSDEVFFQVVLKIISTINISKNSLSIPLEELDLAVQILVVDAFMRCKIFKKPEESI